MGGTFLLERETKRIKLLDPKFKFCLITHFTYDMAPHTLTILTGNKTQVAAIGMNTIHSSASPTTSPRASVRTGSSIHASDDYNNSYANSTGKSLLEMQRSGASSPRSDASLL